MGNNSDYSSSPNIGIVYEALCKRIARCIIENDNVLLKRVKSVIANNLLGAKELSNELNLYNTILNNSFQDRSVAKSFLQECINHAKKIDIKKFDMQMSGLMEATSKVTHPDEVIGTTTNIHHILAEVFTFSRSGNHTVEETAKYYKNIDLLLTRLTVDTEPAVIEERKYPKMDRMVYECAVDRFNKKYSTVLSESQKEIIQDFLMYRSTDRFKRSLLKRVKQIMEQLTVIKKQDKVKDIDLLQTKITEYYDYASKSKTETINSLMLNVCEITELFDEIKKYSV